MQQVALSQKRVRIFYVGGLSEISGKTHTQVIQHFKPYLNLQLLAQFDFEVILNITGAETSWDHIAAMHEAIRSHYNDYDGFVFVHPVDSAAYVLNLLSFASEPFGKPVVFTGPSAIHPIAGSIGYKELYQRQAVSLRTNLLGSIQFATTDASGTFLAYNLEAVESGRAVPHQQAEIMGFTSLQDGAVADLQFGVAFHRFPAGRFTTEAPRLNPFSKHIQIVYAYPAMELDLRSTTADGILIQGMSEQAIPEGLKLPADKPVVVLSRGVVMRKAHNIVQLPYLALPTCLTKMMVGVANTDSPEHFVQWFMQQQRNEPTEIRIIEKDKREEEASL